MSAKTEQERPHCFGFLRRAAPDRDDRRGYVWSLELQQIMAKELQSAKKDTSWKLVTSVRNITIECLVRLIPPNQDKTIEEILLESCPDRDTYSKREV